MANMKLASFIVAAGTILAASTHASAETGRYTMTPTKDGVLKLDTKTGSVSLCRRSSGSWSCQDIKGNDQGLQAQVDRLEKENSRLRAKLDARLSPQDGGKLEIPTEKDVDKAMDFMEKLLKRFKGMAEDLKKDNNEGQGVPL